MIKKDNTGLLAEPETWDKTGGGIMDCDESIIVLRENLLEIRNICQEALEDAILMEVSEDQFREVLKNIIIGLKNPYNNMTAGE